jgi:CRP-like cAMP-binding protein
MPADVLRFDGSPAPDNRTISTSSRCSTKSLAQEANLRSADLREVASNAPVSGPPWSPYAWEAIRSVAFSQSYPPGVLLFAQGTPVRAVGIIEDGLVKLTRWGSQSKDVTVGIRASGWPLGSASAFLEVPHIVTAETLTLCQILLIPADKFRTLVASDERISADLHHVHAWELIDYVSHLAGLGALSARDRLLRFLSELLRARKATGASGPVRITLPLKYAELAQAVVTTRQHLARVLKQLEDERLVVREKGWLVIPDPARFWRSVRRKPHAGEPRRGV